MVQRHRFNSGVYVRPLTRSLGLAFGFDLGLVSLHISVVASYALPNPFQDFTRYVDRTRLILRTLIADAQQRFRSRPLAKQESSIVSCFIIGIAGKESGHTVSINLNASIAPLMPTLFQRLFDVLISLRIILRQLQEEGIKFNHLKASACSLALKTSEK